MRSSRVVSSITLVLLLGIGTGCTGVPAQGSASPTPTPSSDDPAPSPVARPDLAPEVLELGFEGLGSLRVGQSPERSDLVVWDPDYCVFPGDPLDDSEQGRWIAVGEFTPESPAPFSVSAVSDAVDAIELRTDALSTDRDIRQGSSFADLESAYPELSLFETGSVSTVHHVTEAGATMVFEVARETDLGYWAPEEIDTITGILVAPQEIGEKVGVRAASDNVVGGCL